MNKRVLVTGSNGFAGRHMLDYLSNLEDDLSLIGADIRIPNTSEKTAFHEINLADQQLTDQLIQSTSPDYIIHLAGSFSKDQIVTIFKTNVLSISCLLDSVRRLKPDAIVIAAGSAAEYGRVPIHSLPVTENTPCIPINNYGFTKLLASETAQYYHRVYGINVMIVRPFQLIGKGISINLAPGAFARQIKEFSSLESKVLKVGNLESFRDFLDIHDAVRAIWMLCQKPKSGEVFNLCSGKATKLYDLVQHMIDWVGLEVILQVEPERLRGDTDISIIYGNYNKIEKHCQWKPRISLYESITSMFR